MFAFFNSKPVKFINIIIKVCLTILVVSFILMVFLQRFFDNKVSFFNYRMFTVVSGSMLPLYELGDVLLSEEVNTDDIVVGDVVTYMGDKSDFKDKIVTHEVINIEEKDGVRYFTTKGLANIVEDPIVHEKQIFGKVIGVVPILSDVSKIISTSAGFCLFIIIPILFFVVSEVFHYLIEKEEKKRGYYF